MSEPFLAEIRMFAGNFAPRNWAECDGQLLPVTQNTALFSLLGTQFGGDGRATFALPNLQGRIPVGAGPAGALGNLPNGASGGASPVAIGPEHLPPHSHDWPVAGSSEGGPTQGQEKSGLPGIGPHAAYVQARPSAQLEPGTIAPAGGSTLDPNLMPSLTVMFIIALAGVFPPRGG